MTPKLFSVGLGKHGTSSLHNAVRLLGLRSLHDFRRMGAVVKEALQGRVHPLLDEYDAFWDGSFYKCLDFLYQQYPNGHFLLATRERENFIVSRIVHVLHKRVCQANTPTLGGEIDTRAWEQQYRNVHARVRDFFKQHPQARYLEIDVTTGEGWEELCPFLRKPVPAIPFPWDNRGTEKLEAILRVLQQRDRKKAS